MATLGDVTGQVRSMGSARAVVVLAAGACWIGSWRNVMRHDAQSYPRGLLSFVDLSFLHQPSVWWLLTAVTAAGLCSWALRFRQGLSGSMAMAGLWLGAIAEHALFPGDTGVRHGKFMVGAVLLAWLIGYRLVRDRSTAARERHGHEWACGAVAALYLMAGLSKLFAAGLVWGQGGGVALQIAAGGGYGPEPVRALRIWVATDPLLPGLLAAGTLAIELSGVFFIAPRFRRIVAWLTAIMHLGIAFMLGFYYFIVWSPLVFALAYGSLARSEEDVQDT